MNWNTTKCFYIVQHPFWNAGTTWGWMRMIPEPWSMLCLFLPLGIKPHTLYSSSSVWNHRLYHIPHPSSEPQFIPPSKIQGQNIRVGTTHTLKPSPIHVPTKPRWVTYLFTNLTNLPECPTHQSVTTPTLTIGAQSKSSLTIAKIHYIMKHHETVFPVDEMDQRVLRYTFYACL